MSITSLGTLISALTAILFLLVTLLTFRTRRIGRENRELRELRVTNVAYARYVYPIEMLAAANGWDTDPRWPTKPKELSLDYLAGKAEGEGNVELANVVAVMQALRGEPNEAKP